MVNKTILFFIALILIVIGLYGSLISDTVIASICGDGTTLEHTECVIKGIKYTYPILMYQQIMLIIGAILMGYAFFKKNGRKKNTRNNF